MLIGHVISEAKTLPPNKTRNENAVHQRRKQQTKWIPSRIDECGLITPQQNNFSNNLIPHNFQPQHRIPEKNIQHHLL